MLPKFYMMGLDLNDSKVEFSEQDYSNFINTVHQAYENKTIQAYTMLRTCLRVECYYTSESSLNLPDNFFIFEGERAIRYLFELSCGMRSLLKGEDQILSQIKKAYQQTLERKNGDALLNTVFNKAIALGKRFRHISGISTYALSLENLALKKIRSYSDNALHQNIFILGLGELAQSIMYLLIKEGATNISITNRGWHKCVEIATEVGVTPVDFHNKEQALDQADIIISATSAPHYIVRKEYFHNTKNRLFIDLALPRDIEPSLSEIGTLVTIDELWLGKEANLKLRQKLIDFHRYLIDEEYNQLKKRLEHYYA